MDVSTIISTIETVYGANACTYRETKHGKLMTSLFGIPSAHFIRVYAAGDINETSTHPLRMQKKHTKILWLR